MALRTPEEYIASLKDGRIVYFNGEKINDVTGHPFLRLNVQGCAMDYVLAQDPRYRGLFVARTEDGEEVSFYFVAAKNSDDLLRRRRLLQTLVRTGLGRPLSAKMVGADVLNALTVVSRRMDKQLGAQYSPRVEEYRRYLMHNDLTVAGAMTDVKGDRSLRPSKQKPHQDYYVRIVGETKAGVVVRGAKIHIGKAPVSNEIFVCPTRAHREEDRDYAISFAIPANSPGVTLIARVPEAVDPQNVDDYPFTNSFYPGQALVVFEDVVVPHDRVFLKGEWQYSGQIAHMFANFHRLTSDSYKYPELEVLVGLGALLAEYNGLENVSHVREKLSWLIYYAETTEALGLAACYHAVVEREIGVAYPNPLASNLAKMFHADNYHQAVKYVQDIGGGILATTPSFKDFVNPATRPMLEKYLGGKFGVPTEHRLRVVLAARDMLNGFNQTQTIHAEGSLAAQKLSIYALADLERYKAAARRLARISTGEEHATFRELPAYPPDRKRR